MFFELLVNLSIGPLRPCLAEDAILLGSKDFFPLLIGPFDGTGRLLGGGRGNFNHRLLYFGFLFGVGVENDCKTGEAQGGREEEYPFHIGRIGDFF